jgi:hypothetical protein
MNRQISKWVFCALLIFGLASWVSAIDFGWMQPGVRVWYFGGASGLTTSNAVEAYLIQSIVGANVQYVRHSALDFWNSPKPVENLTAPVNDKGSFWMHPAVLQAIVPGDYWLDQQLLTVTRANHTYATLIADMNAPYNLLPSRALFDLAAVRQIVKVTFTIPGTYSIGRAFFDADTGLCVCRDTIFEGYTVFFILGEINYNFAQHAAFAEDDGPHCGFKSFVGESSLGSGGVGGGVVVVQSGIETRYGHKIEMWVISTFTGPYGGPPTATENYYFDADVPIVRRIDHTQAGNYPYDQWNAFGQYPWFWLPKTVTGAQARLNTKADVSLAAPTINVFDVSMTKTADLPLTYAATQNPNRAYFSGLWFDATGYMTKFAAKDPTSGLDIKPTDPIFQNSTTVNGLSYYRSTMGVATPEIRKDDLLGTWDGQGVYFRNSETGAWIGLTSPADVVACGDLYGDGVDDLIGLWSGQAWVKNSANGGWVYLANATRDVAAGDMNGDGRVDFVGTWDGQGVYYKDSISGAWVQLTTPAEKIAAGDLDGDGKADLIGVWTGQGLWVKYSKTGTWACLSTLAPRDFAVGDMDGDGRVDFLGTWDGQGVYYKDSVSGAWVQLTTPADQVAAGDLDGDGIDDLIGNWSGQGLWVKYSKTSTWAHITSAAHDIAAGKLSGGAWSSGLGSPVKLLSPARGYRDNPGVGSYRDLSDQGPRGKNFLCRVEKNLTPGESDSCIQRIPGPGEPGFECIKLESLFPQKRITRGGRERED